MTLLPIRLHPGDDLRPALEAAVRASGCNAAFVISGIGSLSLVSLRLAGAVDAQALHGDYEILTLAGSITANGAHLHLSIADASGQVLGGHAGIGCRVRTTAEVLLALLPDWDLSRAFDPATGYAELMLRASSPPK